MFEDPIGGKLGWHAEIDFFGKKSLKIVTQKRNEKVHLDDFKNQV